MGACGSKKQGPVAPERRVSTLFQDKVVLSFSELEIYYSSAHPFLSAKLAPLYQSVLNRRTEDVTTISLNFAVIGENQATHLGKIIVFFPRLKTLKLWKTRLGVIGMKKLGPSLGYLQSLEYLGVEDNALMDEGVKYLAAGIGRLQNLKELYLQINGIGDDGVAALSQSLADIPRIEVLNLSENALTSAKLRALLSSIAGTIKVLDLAHNKLESQGAQVLADMWPQFRVLEKLSIGGNGLGDEAETLLMSRSSKVQVLV